MNAVLKAFESRTGQLSAMALVLSAGILAVAPVSVNAAGSARSHPCDVRDICSADPGKYVDYRDNGPIKAREYVGEMRWGTGGAPDDVYLVTRTVGSRNFAGAKPCQVRDTCILGQQAPKIVRSGPNGSEIPTATPIESVQASSRAEQK